MNWFCVTAVAVLLSVPFAKVSAATLDEIKKRGSISIAVKSDYQPWGFAGQSGKLQGMEVDLARDIARRLKVKLALVPAVSSNRIQLLNEGKADVVLATFSVTEERKKQVAFIEPSYYAAMTAILHKTGSGIGNEASLKGRAICAVAGNYSNKTVAPFVGHDLIESKTLTEAEEKLRAGECEGVNFDDVVLLYQIKSEKDKWQNYDISLLLSVTPAPWGIAVPLKEKDGALAKFLSRTVNEWHRKGTLLRLEKKWVGDNSMALAWLSSKVKAAEVKKPKTPGLPKTAPATLSR
jgi:polar amino acid transport system substrate-binding protein